MEARAEVGVDQLKNSGDIVQGRFVNHLLHPWAGALSFRRISYLPLEYEILARRGADPRWGSSAQNARRSR
jgi:hypothetical protein